MRGNVKKLEADLQEHRGGASMRKIMVATDGSEGATRAIDMAVELTKAFGGTLSIVSVAATISAEDETSFMRVEGDAMSPSETLAQRNLNEAQRRAQQAGVPAQTILVTGDPARAIIETIVREKVDAIAVGRRGRGQLAGLLLGSVSQKLCSLAPCVVIVSP